MKVIGNTVELQVPRKIASCNSAFSSSSFHDSELLIIMFRLSHLTSLVHLVLILLFAPSFYFCQRYCICIMAWFVQCNKQGNCFEFRNIKFTVLTFTPMCALLFSVWFWWQFLTDTRSTLFVSKINVVCCVGRVDRLYKSKYKKVGVLPIRNLCFLWRRAYPTLGARASSALARDKNTRPFTKKVSNATHNGNIAPTGPDSRGSSRSHASRPRLPARRFFLRVRKKLWHPGLAYARNVVDFTVSVSAVHQPFYIRSVQVSISACSQNNYFAERQNFQVARKATITPLRHMCSISKYKKLVYCRCRKCLTFQA